MPRARLVPAVLTRLALTHSDLSHVGSKIFTACICYVAEMNGYEKLSALTARFPEVLILRRFDKLTARILLRRQAELLHLEQALEVFIEGDTRAYPSINTCWGSSRDVEQEKLLHLQKYAEVEEKLKTYRKG